MALFVVAAAGVFLVVLGIMALVRPREVRGFLLGFAATPTRHCVELGVRMTVGLAFMLASPQLPASGVFFMAGAVLLGTTLVMAVLPFRLHQAFAKRSVTTAIPYLPLIGLASLAAGSAVAWSVYATSVT